MRRIKSEIDTQIIKLRWRKELLELRILYAYLELLLKWNIEIKNIILE